MNTIFSFAIGTGKQNKKGQWLEVFYPEPQLGVSEDVIEIVKEILWYDGGNEALSATNEQIRILCERLDRINEHQLAQQARLLSDSKDHLVVTVLATDEPPISTPEAYLKLHLLSHRLVKPHTIQLQGIFPLLPNVAWTNQGAIDLEELPEKQLQSRLAGELLTIFSIDKFPQMTNYVVPKGVRIGNTARVRLGAFIGEGTTVMHEGFVNFNAGTEGTAMIEGRISAGVFVGEGTDLGGGCSTMGTLSGGNDTIISLGAGCLIGANAGVGIPLGDRCTIEAGLYITAGSIVEVIDNNGEVTGKIKARDLSGKSDLLFRRHSLSGSIQVLTNQSAIELNHELHQHN